MVVTVVVMVVMVLVERGPHRWEPIQFEIPA